MEPENCQTHSKLTKLWLKNNKHVHFTDKATGIVEYLDILDWFLQTHDLPQLDAVLLGNIGLIARSDVMFTEFTK